MANLDLSDIQGNILAGFNTEVEVFVGLTLEGSRLDAAAGWLSALAPDVTTVDEVESQRLQMRAVTSGSGLVWLCVGLGSYLMAQLRPDIVFFDDGFVRGLQKRAGPVLGDRTDPGGWRVGGPSKRLDVLLIVASNDATAALDRASVLVSSAASVGLNATYRETTHRLGALEHFGFRDGVSQPTVRGYRQAAGTHSPGHFVFGYERFPNEPEFLPAGDPGDFLRNGSFLVFRRLAQDVASFRDFCARKSNDVAEQLPGLTPDHLAALLVGRWPSGAPVTMGQASDPCPGANDDGFDFMDDLDGAKCPVGAHIRKVNPRAGQKDVVDVPRLLRRGIPFGPAYDLAPAEERGLAFVSFQTSIQDQFEFLQSRWMNSPARPAPSAGHDLLVGRARNERSLSLLGPAGNVEISDGLQQWVTPTGGGYLFAPGRSAMSRIGQPHAPGLAWRTQRLLSNAKGILQDIVGDR